MKNIALKKYKSFEYKNNRKLAHNLKNKLKKHGNIKQFTASNLYNKSITNYKDL